MAGILIVAHEPLASALKDCVAHIYEGLPERVEALDITPGQDPAELVEMARAELLRLIGTNGALVLTDIVGGTPSNVAARLATKEVQVIAGVNLPMLVRAICYRSTPLDALVEKVLAGGAKGIQLLDPTAVLATPSLSVPCPPENYVATRNRHR